MNPNMEEGMGAAAWLVVILAALGIIAVVGSAVWLLVTHC